MLFYEEFLDRSTDIGFNFSKEYNPVSITR